MFRKLKEIATSYTNLGNISNESKEPAMALKIENHIEHKESSDNHAPLIPIINIVQQRIIAPLFQLAISEKVSPLLAELRKNKFGVLNHCRSAIWIVILKNALQKINHPSMLDLNHDDILNLQILCLFKNGVFQDSGNVWEIESQKQCEDFFVSIGLKAINAYKLSLFLSQNQIAVYSEKEIFLKKIFNSALALKKLAKCMEFKINLVYSV